MRCIGTWTRSTNGGSRPATTNRENSKPTMSSPTPFSSRTSPPSKPDHRPLWAPGPAFYLSCLLAPSMERDIAPRRTATAIRCLLESFPHEKVASLTQRLSARLTERSTRQEVMEAVHGEMLALGLE